MQDLAATLVLMLLTPVLLSCMSISMTRVSARNLARGASFGFPIRWFVLVRDYCFLMVAGVGALAGLAGLGVIDQLAAVLPSTQFFVIAVSFLGFLWFGWVTENALDSLIPSFGDMDWREGLAQASMLMFFASANTVIMLAGMRYVVAASDAAWPGVWSAMLFLLALLALVALGVNNALLQAKPGEPRPLEGYPIYTELNRMLDGQGIEPREWTVRELRRIDGADPTQRELMQALQGWALEHRSQIVDWIPGVLLHQMEPKHLTALVATLESIRGGNEARKESNAKSTGDKLIGMAFGTLIFLLLLVCGVGFFGSWFDWDWSLTGATLAIVLVLAMTMESIRTNRRRTPEILRKAYRAWVQAGEGEERGVADFVDADILHDRISIPTATPLMHYLVMMTNKPLVQFVNEETGGRARELIAQRIDLAYDGALAAVMPQLSKSSPNDDDLPRARN